MRMLYKDTSHLKELLYKTYRDFLVEIPVDAAFSGEIELDI
jgi:hypothetical protein